MMRTLLFPYPAVPHWLCGIVGLTAAVSPTFGQEEGDGDWTRHFRLGMQIGLNLRADFSMSGQFPISGSQPGATGVSGVNHFYDDGYVRVDRTGNAQGYTSFWGYQNASQYNPATQTLTMHSATSFTYGGGSTSGNDQPYLGLDLAYGGDISNWGPTKIGWEFGFGLLPIDIQDSQPLTASFSQVSQTFKTIGLVVPTAPYNGGPSGLGPTIQDVATAGPSQTIPGTISGTRSLEVMLYNFRLGPTLYWPFHSRFALQAGGGFALGLVSGDYKFSESAVFADGSRANNSGQIGGTELAYGGYVGATLLYHLQKHADLYLGAQFMPLGNTTINGQGRQARLDLGSGVYISAGLNWPF